MLSHVRIMQKEKLFVKLMKVQKMVIFVKNLKKMHVLLYLVKINQSQKYETKFYNR